MSDFLVLREVDSIEPVMHDFYAHRSMLNVPLDVVNQEFYGERILFYVHSLRARPSMLAHPFAYVKWIGMEGVQFNQSETPLGALFHDGGFARLEGLIQHCITIQRAGSDGKLASL